ncbi:MAG: DUF3800 domain-containing protein [Candidatus Stygibacter australis]|nr:DUF3800 domain-containing protein [Candidatus Stygibacter australis]MDP8322805.1 DUF3800 domain-containing protein [Candidatus Stygibacter australis]
MNNQINIYCDESCHLENDGNKVMTLGAIWCDRNKVSEINREIRGFKVKHSINKFAEIKWVKVSPSKKEFYIDLINYFFNKQELHFRVLVVPDKTKLDHRYYNQTHDDFYYKMYFNLIKVIWQPHVSYNVFLDIKDTKGGYKIKKLHEILCSHHYDYRQEIINQVQQVRSHEVELIQLTDLLLGAVTYANRNLEESKTKLELIELIRQRSELTLLKKSYLSETKFNVFIWEPNYGI